VTSTEERAALQLRADASGRLVNAAGRPLASNGEHTAIFVLQQSGALLVTLDWLAPAPTPPMDACTDRGHPDGGSGAHRQRFFHSSLVAGMPVAAAGVMRIENGRLLSLSNESGHYAPPPSCLAHVMSRLAGLGVAELESVQIEHVSTSLTQPEARPMSGDAAHAQCKGGVSPIAPRPQHATGRSTQARLRVQRVSSSKSDDGRQQRDTS
jgi:hypothetical protein